MRVGKAKRAHHRKSVQEMVGTALRAFAHPTHYSPTFTSRAERASVSSIRFSGVAI